MPNALGLERYDDVAEPFSYGKFVYALVRPVAEPLYQARPAGDVVIDAAYKLGISLGVSDALICSRPKPSTSAPTGVPERRQRLVNALWF